MRESLCSVGYSPILSFEVESLEICRKKALQYGAFPDGDIKENSEFKIGCFRSPDGVVVSLMELKEDVQGYFGNISTSIEEEKEKNDSHKNDKNMEEIKDILRNIKI